MKRAFTLIEVNLAMLIMAGGILSIVGLYSFGFRENRQSREDVASAAFADAVVSPLVMAISATNLRWSAFRNIASYPDANGWGYYIDTDGQVSKELDAESVFSKAMSAYSGASAGGTAVRFGYPTEAQTGAGLSGALVVLHETDSPVVRIGFRATKTKGQLMAMPLYYTEVRFQGILDQ